MDDFVVETKAAWNVSGVIKSRSKGLVEPPIPWSHGQPPAGTSTDGSSSSDWTISVDTTIATQRVSPHMVRVLPYACSRACRLNVQWPGWHGKVLRQ